MPRQIEAERAAVPIARRFGGLASAGCTGPVAALLAETADLSAHVETLKTQLTAAEARAGAKTAQAIAAFEIGTKAQDFELL
jgi:hypothetical protein